MENTKENKARLFAQYWGQEVAAYNIQEKPVIYKADILWPTMLNISYLLLTPLSAITDEDAIYITQSILKIKDIAKEDCKCFSSGYLRNLSNTGCVRYEVIDYLRSRGYALPYLDASVEDLVSMGWVKLKTE